MSGENGQWVVVQPGDTLSHIAARTGGDVEDILWHDHNSFIKKRTHQLIFPKDKVWVPKKGGVAYPIAEETVSAPPEPVNDTQREIRRVCDELCEMLVAKNRAYGDSALSPLRVFSRADTVEQIKVRLDDKLSRLSRGHALADESLDDTVTDLMGYLVLLRVAARRESGKK